MTSQRVGRWSACFAAAALLAGTTHSATACPQAHCFGWVGLGGVFEESGLIAEGEVERVFTPASYVIEHGFRALSNALVPVFEKIDPDLGAFTAEGLSSLRKKIDSPEKKVDLRLGRIHHDVAESERISAIFWRGEGECPSLELGERNLFLISRTDAGEWRLVLWFPAKEWGSDLSEFGARLARESASPTGEDRQDP